MNRHAGSVIDILGSHCFLGVPQSQFYQYAAYGEYRNASMLAGGPPATGGKKALLSAGVQTIAAEFARDETAHVRAYARAVSLRSEN